MLLNAFSQSSCTTVPSTSCHNRAVIATCSTPEGNPTPSCESAARIGATVCFTRRAAVEPSRRRNTLEHAIGRLLSPIPDKAAARSRRSDCSGITSGSFSRAVYTLARLCAKAGSLVAAVLDNPLPGSSSASIAIDVPAAAHRCSYRRPSSPPDFPAPAAAKVAMISAAVTSKRRVAPSPAVPAAVPAGTSAAIMLPVACGSVGRSESAATCCGPAAVAGSGGV